MSNLSRRRFMATSAGGLAAVSTDLALADASVQSQSSAPPAAIKTGPFDSLRDYIAVLDAHGLVLRIPELDQDAYEGTALMYRLLDEHGIERAPVLLFEKVKIDGEWIEGPVLANEQGHWDTEAFMFGLDPIPGDHRATYRRAKDYHLSVLEQNDGTYPQIPPVQIARDAAPCKEVVLTGDDIDLTAFPFFQSNPSDAGRYINTGSVFTEDPEMGINFGTYRCQLKGPRKIGVNSEPNQTGWKMLMAAKERGEKTAKASIVLGNDPIAFIISSSRLAGRRGKKPVDELALVGGLKGRALDVVKSETNDFLVPAHAEMIIEGEIPLDDFEPEGPYGEMYGYMGLAKESNFWMQVTAVTHRKNPWFVNSFTGVNRGRIGAPGDALSLYGLQKRNPDIVDIQTRNDATGITFISINKTKPGQGLEVGKSMAEFNPIAKIVMVVDSDIDLLRVDDLLLALGSRWQPFTASHIYEELRGMPLDPSSPNRPMTSKIVIDATRQWPEEGGPAVYPELNRTLLVQGAPDAFSQVNTKYADVIKQSYKY